MLKVFFFQLPKVKKCCFWGRSGEVAPTYQVIKRLKIDICGSTCCIPLHAATATECGKKNKEGMLVTEILNTCTR